MKSYIVASIGECNYKMFADLSPKMDGQWYLCTTPEELNALLEDVSPEYIFFPHWRWIVSEKITSGYECVCFHMTDVPYGRGGSPLQNLIVRGKKETKISALRMVQEPDAGPVYCKEEFALYGSAREIYNRASSICWKLIKIIISESPSPVPQTGPVTYFKRRVPAQSALPSDMTPEQVYDFIRMLDADGYPHAFIETESYRLEFTNAEYHSDSVIANVKFTKRQ